MVKTGVIGQAGQDPPDKSQYLRPTPRPAAATHRLNLITTTTLRYLKFTLLQRRLLATMKSLAEERPVDMLDDKWQRRAKIAMPMSVRLLHGSVHDSVIFLQERQRLSDQLLQQVADNPTPARTLPDEMRFETRWVTESPRHVIQGDTSDSPGRSAICPMDAECSIFSSELWLCGGQESGGCNPCSRAALRSEELRINQQSTFFSAFLRSRFRKKVEKKDVAADHVIGRSAGESQAGSYTTRYVSDLQSNHAGMAPSIIYTKDRPDV